MSPESTDLALDFANTCGWHASPNPVEGLTSYAAAVTWAQENGILSNTQAQNVLAQAQARPVAEKEALERIIAFREAVYHIFAAVAHDKTPDPSDLEILNYELREALTRLRLDVIPKLPVESPSVSAVPATHPRPSPPPEDLYHFTWTWTDTEDQLTSLLWPLARAAAHLLTSPQLSRVRECAGHPCGWLFLDRSKNASRRWCDMADCGNRAKARRYRERRKAEPRS